MGNMEIFACKKCGHCCEGKGGIVLTKKDVDRLGGFFALSIHDFLNKYAVERSGKKFLRAVVGKCVFFKSGTGCEVHEYKPDICRAWPFFRGNLEDEISLSMAKEFCPGIDRECGFEEFAMRGREYLRENDLVHDEAEAPEALKVAHLFERS